MDTPQPPSDRTLLPVKKPEIKIGLATRTAQAGDREIEIPIYTVTLGSETIELLPFKNWIQLDVHKWVVQGKLPASPAGLEVTFDHVKIAGETVLGKDPDGCAKLERVFNDWLELEQGTTEMAKKRLHSKPATTASAAKRHESQPLHYQVQLGQEQQVHIRCLQGKEVLASIGLNLPGFNSLVDQGLLRKPRNLQVGILHDWVELDGVLYSFEKGNNDSAKLERILNERYLSNLALGQGKDVVVFANAASSTGFDIQFTALLGGVPDNRRRPLNEDTLELLQDSNRCGLLQSGLVIKLTRPTLIFKQKTPDGGERNLQKSAENTVAIRADTGQEKVIDLSQPVNYLRLSAVELTAVFNHPAINKRGKVPTSSSQQGPINTSSSEVFPMTTALAANIPSTPVKNGGRQHSLAVRPLDSAAQTTDEVRIAIPKEILTGNAPIVSLADSVASVPKATTSPVTPMSRQADSEPTVQPAVATITTPEFRPNHWLKPILGQAPIRFDWFSCLVYDKIAEHFGNSHQGQLGPMSCWAVALSETEDLEDPAFQGIFLTEKHGLGFLHSGRMVRFYKGVVFIGTDEPPLEGIGVDLVAVGVDAEQHIVFILGDDYLEKFDVPEFRLAEELGRLKESGAAVMSVSEALNGPAPLEIVWSVPAEQQNPMDPQPLESVRDG